MPDFSPQHQTSGPCSPCNVPPLVNDPAHEPDAAGSPKAAEAAATSQNPAVAGATPRSSRPRYQQKQRSALQKVPLSVWILAPIAIVTAGWLSFRAWKGSRTVVTFVGAGGAPVPPLELQLFHEQLAFTAPSPPTPYFTQLLADGNEIVFGADEVPQSALLRYSGKGIGVGFASITRGRPAEIRLAAPGSVEGRVGTAAGLYAMGLRTLGMEPVVGARVVAMGGGEHGIALCESVTDAEGRFRLEGFSSDLPALGIRVLAKGYALAFSSQFLEADLSVVVPMLSTQSIRGRVTLPDGVSHERLRVLAKGLPGVESVVAADGSFELDHVGPTLEPRLLVHGLPTGLTHAQVNAHAGQEGIAIKVVPDVVIRGRVIERMRQSPMAGAMVWHDSGPNGGVTVQADDDGRFEIRGAPAGQLMLRAQCTIRTEDGEKETLAGERSIAIEAGKELGEVVVRVD